MFVSVTHDQTETLTLVSKIVVIREGETQQLVPLAEIYIIPGNHQFAAGFIGTPQMYVFKALIVITGDDGTCKVRVGCISMTIPITNQKIFDACNVEEQQITIALPPRRILMRKPEESLLMAKEEIDEINNIGSEIGKNKRKKGPLGAIELKKHMGVEVYVLLTSRDKRVLRLCRSLV